MENIFIYEKQNSLPIDTCEMIINLYEEEGTKRYEGVTVGGVNKEVKDTLDYLMPNDDNITWKRINNMLVKELKQNLKVYLENFTTKYQLDICKITDIFIEPFLIQRYTKCKGKYIYHHDGCLRENDYRVLTYLWYLNDVNEGGETEFFGKFKIKPEVGKLIIFPANWTFPHCGKVPISNNKYILTGWMYITKDYTHIQKQKYYNANTTDVSTQTTKSWYNYK